MTCFALNRNTTFILISNIKQNWGFFLQLKINKCFLVYSTQFSIVNKKYSIVEHSIVHCGFFTTENFAFFKQKFRNTNRIVQNFSSAVEIVLCPLIALYSTNRRLNVEINAFLFLFWAWYTGDNKGMVIIDSNFNSYYRQKFTTR